MSGDFVSAFLFLFGFCNGPGGGEGPLVLFDVIYFAGHVVVTTNYIYFIL